MAQEGADDASAGTENGGAAEAVAFYAVKPQLYVQAPKAAEAVQFYKAAFGAEELKRSTYPKRKADQELPHILCAEIRLGPIILIVCDNSDDTAKSTDGVGFCLVTDDVEAAVENAVKAGAVALEAAAGGEAGCCGERYAKVKDPFGFVWAICTAGKSCGPAEADAF